MAVGRTCDALRRTEFRGRRASTAGEAIAGRRRSPIYAEDGSRCLSGGRLPARVVGVRFSLGRRGSLIDTARIARATLTMNVLARRIEDHGSA